MRLTPFNLTQNISVDNALSTIQVIHQIITKVNNVVDYVNNLENNSNKYTDEQIKIVLEQLENNLTDLENTLKLYVDNKVDNLKSYVDNENNDIKTLIDNKVEKIYNDINDLEQSLKNYIDLNDTEIKLLIYEIKDELINLINQGKEKVFSPVDGRSKSIQQALYDIFNLIKIDVGCITLKFAKKMISNDLSVQGTDGNSLYFGNITLGDFKNSTYYNMSSIYLNLSNYATGSNPQSQHFIFHNRLDCIRLYCFELLYVVALSYLINNGLELNLATTYLNTTLYSSLGVGYGSAINTHAWNHI